MTDPKSALRKIIKVVLSLHALFLVFMMINFKPSKKKMLYAKKTLKENVRMIQKSQPRKVVAAAKKPQVGAPAKKAVAKAVAKPSVTVKAKKALPKLEKMPDPPKEEIAAIILPKAIAQLGVEEAKIDEVEEEVCGRYVENLHHLITEKLNLKPNSYVSIELRLNQKGGVIDIKHLHSSDVIAKDTIMQKIKEIEFPNFFAEIAGESDYTFVLTLKSQRL